MSDNIVESVETLGLIDSGAGGKFIDQDFTRESGFKTLKLEEPLRVLNVDGCKVTIPRGTGQSYGIRWRSGMRVTDGTKVTDG